MATNPRQLRADDVPQIPITDPAIKGYELVNGELLPIMGAKREHARLMLLVGARLLRHVEHTGNGEVFADVWWKLRLARDPERLRAPDVAYYGAEKLSASGEDEMFRLPPDLAVEIYSSTDDRKPRKDFQQRIRDYLDASVQLLWVFYPEARYVMVHRPDGSARMVRETEALEGEDILPGFRLELSEVFR